MKKNEISIDNKKIGNQYPPYIIAELSANHNGSLKTATETIKMAKLMGADAIKIQTYTADTMTIDSNKDDFQIKKGLWNGYNLYQLYKEAHTPYKWHKALFDYAKSIGITIFSTPFDESAVDFLEELNTPAYKIASFELTDLPLIEYIAKTGKPIIMSTGMANVDEIEEAISTARLAGCKDLIVLHCISAYPAPIEQSNLKTMVDLANRFSVLSGLSDHTLGTIAATTATALGANVIEKHVTLSRENKGPDSDFSLEPNELKALCVETKIAWSALGSVGYTIKQAENDNQRFRRSIYFVNDLKKGDIITEHDIRRIRPGFGLSPKYFDELIGKKVNQDICRGTASSWALISSK